ncbi:MAG: DUF1993 domain-containing protein [Patescibacteria group bacterium]|nr:DUF1993 domain-containing protein [Patescibacteria group bacterium]MDE1945350.1 DUF1993 domain-containing protein [Patescibacteria group bacterium]MDE2058025.1 DUF1993 domain-containing protein [Patescibacteria group bacterium]
MDHDLYAFTVPVFSKMLGGLKTVLEKAKAHGLDEAALVNDRLAPDMFDFKKQVQSACDNAKGCAARLAGVEIPKYEDTETTLDELIARIDKTLAFLTTITEAQYASAQAAEVQVVLPYFKDQFMTGYDYAREYAIPNFFFHTAMAYALVRKAGVAIGKADYINGVPLQPF